MKNAPFFTSLPSSPPQPRCGVSGAGVGDAPLSEHPLAKETRGPRRGDTGPSVPGSVFPAGPGPWALPSAAPARSARRRAGLADLRLLP